MVSGGQQRDSAMHIHVFILPQTPLPSRLAEFLLLYSRFLLVIHYKYSSVYMLIPISWTVLSSHPSYKYLIRSFKPSPSSLSFATQLAFTSSHVLAVPCPYLVTARPVLHCNPSWHVHLILDCRVWNQPCLVHFCILKPTARRPVCVE